MNLFKSILALAILAALSVIGSVAVFPQHGVPGIVVWLLLVNALGAGMLNPTRARLGCAHVTLTSTEILMDVLNAFVQFIPGLNRMGTDFRGDSLKLNKTYDAHISTLPAIATYDATTGYANGATEARDLLTDIPVLVDMHRHVPIKWSHLYQIQDDKIEYKKATGGAAYVLARYVMQDIAAKINSRRFSQHSIFAEADCDYDMLNGVTGAMNLVGGAPFGRAMLVNTPAANTLSADSRITSRDFAGQLPNGVSLRRFRAVGGFEEVIEFPELPLNNATALSSVAAEADDDIVTKAAHGLSTGDRVVFTSGTGFTGLTATTAYYAIVLSSSTFKLATTRALAQAGTAVNITADGSDGVFTPTENLVGFGFDPRAIALLTGIPEDFNAAIQALGIPQIMGFETVTHETGLTMAAVKWQAPGTGIVYWSPTLVWGSELGAQAGTRAAGYAADYAGHRVIKA